MAFAAFATTARREPQAPTPEELRSRCSCCCPGVLYLALFFLDAAALAGR